MKAFLNMLSYLGVFALGLWFYSKVLDKPETVNKIKRLKQKKGYDNVMTVEVKDRGPGKRKARRKQRKQKRKKRKND